MPRTPSDGTPLVSALFNPSARVHLELPAFSRSVLKTLGEPPHSRLNNLFLSLAIAQKEYMSGQVRTWRGLDADTTA